MFDNKYPYTDFHELNLDWVIEELQKVSINLDTLEERVLKASVEASKKYIDDNIIPEFNALSARFDALINYVDLQIDVLNNQYSQFTSNIQAQMALMNNRIDAFRAELDASIIGVNARTDLAIKLNNEYILEEVSKGVVGAKVINYFTGARIPIQDMFNYLCLLHVDNGITYSSLADRNKTYDEYAGYNMTYTDLAKDGSIIII